MVPLPVRLVRVNKNALINLLIDVSDDESWFRGETSRWPVKWMKEGERYSI